MNINPYVFPAINVVLDLQLFAEAGNLVNTTTGTVNAYTAAATTSQDMTPGMKEYYNTQMLENHRERMIFGQLGKKQRLPANHGKWVEWRKWKTLPDADKLTEGVIPTGKTFGQTSVKVEIAQYGEYVAISDVLDTHHVDPVILGATEELSYATSLTNEKLTRAVLSQGTNVLMADLITAAGAYDSTPATRADLVKSGCTSYLTPDMINKAVTKMRKEGVPYYSGNKYVCVIHPSCAYDLRKSPDWIEAHKYSATTEIFNGEIGELHGMRFIESNLAPVIYESASLTVYQAMCFGKDAFGIIDPEGAGMETIIKDRAQVGGPLNQFSTVGCKFSTGAKILYHERLLTIECTSSYGNADVPAGTYSAGDIVN